MLALALLVAAPAQGASVADFDLTRTPAAGDQNAGVVVVEYACARCPFCAQLTPALHAAVETGALKGKAQLYLKIFPIKGHAGAKEAAMAFVAAHELGKFWPYALYAFRHFNEFTVDKLATWAQALGLNQEAFARLSRDPKLADLLVANKKEGIALGVDGTPTLFINGRKYVGKNTLEDIIAAIQAAPPLASRERLRTGAAKESPSVP
ncbi:MAG: thioredoxin domain-containing protein [Deltaproteobacteria bacterium]|nr:thioredoxin domain-containing protein [Deltaproteobacteria bacterium]